MIALAGMTLHWLEEQDAAIGLIAPNVQTLRDRGAVTPLAFPLVVLASIHMRRGDFLGARELAREAAAVGEEAIGPLLQAITWNTRAFAAAYLAEDEVCVTNATRARAICERLGIYSHRAVAEQALGMRALGVGELDAAIEHLERGRESRLRYGIGDPGYMFNESDLTEAYIRAGRLADAERSLAELRAGAAATGGAWAAAAVARYAALLGEDGEIDGYLEAASAAHERVDFAFEEARTKLIFGERLRRARRRSDARPLLTAAEAAFRAQGAVRWADRAAAELRAGGLLRGGTHGVERGPRDRRRGADRARARGLRAGRRRRQQRPGGGGALHLAADGRAPPAQHLPQGRRALARPARRPDRRRRRAEDQCFPRCGLSALRSRWAHAPQASRPPARRACRDGVRRLRAPGRRSSTPPTGTSRSTASRR